VPSNKANIKKNCRILKITCWKSGYVISKDEISKVWFRV